MKKQKIKKIIFYITLLPYFIIALKCINYSIIGYKIDSELVYFGLDAIKYFFNDIQYSLTGIIFKPYIGILFLLWVGYQMFYIVTFNKNTNQINRKITFKKIFYYISILCWIIYFASGIKAFFFGYDITGLLGDPQIIYGVDALLNILFLNLIKYCFFIPILPCSLLYIIIYKIKNKK